ncbi:MAG: ABC-F family ATP-binding cassette domain-containing protein [Campylobacterales bacterium]|nr:ABC-F family ATP-binding cassette domain-containing protein [Campylobacterales bacterium]
MALIDLFDIKQRYDIKVLFDDVDFHLNEGERIALIGQNGCGKSTLMKIVSNKIEPDAGKRVIQNNIEIDILSQNPIFEENCSVREAIELQLVVINSARKEFEILSQKIATDFQNKKLQEELNKLTAFIDHHNAWSLDDKIERILSEFKLKEFEHRLVNSLSGGEQRRVALAALILKKPNVLLLDEPTNHLDVYMVEFLEEILLKEKFTLLFISHDRYFIDRLATRVCEIENQKLINYKGGYEAYLRQKEERLNSMKKSHENLLRLLKQEEEWLQKGVRAREKRNQGRKKRVFELREEAKINPSMIRKISIELEREKKHFNRDKSIAKKKMLFEVEHLRYDIQSNCIIKDFSTRILQHDKIAVAGINGSGKSTLLQLLLGTLQPSSGTIKKGDFEIGYFDQHRDMLKDDATLLETFCPNGGDTIEVNGSNVHVYGYLKSFLFPQEFLDKKIGLLSGGEKNRVALALLFAKKVDCLILDEPTNDLDIQTITILEEKLLHFSGALIVVSHDRYFIDKIASKLFIFKGDSTIEESYGAYSEYLEIEKELKEIKKIEEQLTTKEKNEKDEKKVRDKNKFSYKEQREFESLPKEIEELESEIRATNICLSNPECYKEKGLTELGEKLNELQCIYEEKSERYLELLELYESFC